MTGAAFLTAQGLNVILAGRIVLKDVSLSLSPGHLVALVGPNGADRTGPARPRCCVLWRD